MNPDRSLHVVLATGGSRGDVQPMLALSQTLVARGHVPVVAAPPNFETWIRNLGFKFAPLGVDIQVFLAEHSDALTGNPVKMLKEMSRYFNQQIPLQARQLEAICDRADAVIYGELAFTTPTVAAASSAPPGPDSAPGLCRRTGAWCAMRRMPCSSRARRP